MDIRKIDETAVEAWVRDCDRGGYVPLNDVASGEVRTLYRQMHAYLHLSGRLNALGKMIEPTGHGRPLDPGERAAHLETVAKVIIDAVGYARFSGFTIDELEAVLERLCAARAP